ncbi:GtrA family protein [Leifsonia sp. YIM 134122]|uniref:GtrA family protein n=1 Tax=Leifsonia stereocauli TaxID=3134136 RepID=A0ABU9W123_9MICO
MIVLIPAYQPDAKLIALVRAMRAERKAASVVVVDDGSGDSHSAVFATVAALGAEVIGWRRNRGKGQALKAGFAYVLEEHPGVAVVTADADGQHTVVDILRVADALEERAVDGTADDDARPAIVLGGRRFTGTVPRRSRAGNAAARGAFRLATGQTVHDTQTGLRGYPAATLRWLLGVRGDRFEYELTVLIRAASEGLHIREIPIDTVYLDNNASSHFRPVVDTARVLLPFLAFAASSLGAAVVDTVGLLVLFALTGSLPSAAVGARLASASVNFAVNRHLVFRSTRPTGIRRSALRYAALAVALLATSYVWLAVLTGAGMPLLPAKLLTDGVLYLVGFQVQRRFVFGRRATDAARVPEASAGVGDPDHALLGDAGQQHAIGAEDASARQAPTA